MKMIKLPTWIQIKCKIGLHKSNRDYGLHWSSGKVFSECVHCNQAIHHPKMSSHGGGN